MYNDKNLEKAFKEKFLIALSEKINKGTLEEYLNSFEEDKLKSIIGFSTFIDDYVDVEKIVKSSKDELVDYIIKNLNIIIESFVLVMSENNINQLCRLVHDKKNVYKYSDYLFSFDFYGKLVGCVLGKIEYNEKDDTISFYIQKEIKEEIIKLLDCLTFRKVNNKYNEIINYLEKLLHIYGIITFDEFHRLFIKQMYLIDKEELSEIIHYKLFLLPEYIYNEKDKILICSLNFDTKEEAIKYYKKQTNDYKEYELEELDEFFDLSYILNLESYVDFMDYVEENYDFDEKLEYLLRQNIIEDYLLGAQYSLKTANSNFKKNIVKILDIDNEGIKTLLKIMNKMYKESPKWEKRGNI